MSSFFVAAKPEWVDMSLQDITEASDLPEGSFECSLLVARSEEEALAYVRDKFLGTRDLYITVKHADSYKGPVHEEFSQVAFDKPDLVTPEQFYQAEPVGQETYDLSDQMVESAFRLYMPDSYANTRVSSVEVKYRRSENGNTVEVHKVLFDGKPFMLSIRVYAHDTVYDEVCTNHNLYEKALSYLHQFTLPEAENVAVRADKPCKALTHLGGPTSLYAYWEFE